MGFAPVSIHCGLIFLKTAQPWLENAFMQYDKQVKQTNKQSNNQSKRQTNKQKLNFFYYSFLQQKTWNQHVQQFSKCPQVLIVLKKKGAPHATDV